MENLLEEKASRDFLIWDKNGYWDIRRIEDFYSSMYLI